MASKEYKNFTIKMVDLRQISPMAANPDALKTYVKEHWVEQKMSTRVTSISAVDMFLFLGLETGDINCINLLGNSSETFKRHAGVGSPAYHIFGQHFAERTAGGQLPIVGVIGRRDEAVDAAGHPPNHIHEQADTESESAQGKRASTH